MFYHLKGIITDIVPGMAVVECGGVGYGVYTSMYTLSQLHIGTEDKLYISEAVREDAFDLYGFKTLSEKNCFEHMISVSGVGPKAAISILSSSTPDGIYMAVMSGNEKALTVAPGIGKKIAQRIILELKDKIAKEQQSGGFVPTAAAVSVGGGKSVEAAQALSVLGYTQGDIAAAMKGLDVESLPLEEIVRQALKRMVK